MADILKKIKDWDFTSKDSNVNLNLDYCELAEIGDIIDRKIWFTDEVDTNIINTVVYNVMRYNSMDKGIPVEDRKPIKLYISSIGGDVTAGLGLVSAIQTSKTPVYTIAVADAASMGLILAISGHKRYAMPNAVYLMHDGSTGVIDSSAKARDRISFDCGELADRLKKIILEKTKLSKKQYDEKYRTEWYFLPDVAKKYGFTDYIIGEDCELDEII